MGQVVRMNAPTPFTAPQWPIAGDVPDLLVIVQDQATTIAAQDALIQSYQAWLNLEQAPGGPVIATGNSTNTTSLTLSGVGGAITLGAMVNVVGTPGPATIQIVGQSSGPTGGNGVYLTNVATTFTNASLAIVNPKTPPAAYGTGTASGTPATTLTVAGLSGTIAVPCRVTGPGITVAPTNIIAQQSGPAGGNGVYTTDQITTCNSAALSFIPPALTMTWPIPRDALTLTTIQQDQTAILRSQTALIQQYQMLLNDSQVQPPLVGP
jgi:hypothetical protein